MKKMDNYSVVIQTINELYKKFYQVIEEYFENIFNAPSTVNRIIKYYALGFVDDDFYNRYIMFGGQIVRTYSLDVPEFKELLIRSDLY